jgi:hypothetical protein
MKRRRHTPEQIIRKLRAADRLLAEGQDVPEVAKQLEALKAGPAGGRLRRPSSAGAAAVDLAGRSL